MMTSFHCAHRWSHCAHFVGILQRKRKKEVSYCKEKEKKKATMLIVRAFRTSAAVLSCCMHCGKRGLQQLRHLLQATCHRNMITGFFTTGDKKKPLSYFFLKKTISYLAVMLHTLRQKRPTAIAICTHRVGRGHRTPYFISYGSFSENEPSTKGLIFGKWAVR